MKKSLFIAAVFAFASSIAYAGQMITLPDKLVLVMPTDQAEYLGHEKILGATGTGVSYGGVPVIALKLNAQLIGDGGLRVKRSYVVIDIPDNPDTPENETDAALTTMIGDAPTADVLEQRMKAFIWGKLQAEFPLLSDVLSQICP